ncbi:oligopeptide transport system ATP-binding protein [Acetomicrobium thermoterrenum DSM 13490]|uniref:Oligopeptide transport system ATP-binding protein n=1 Tax=Acetomicrobium thermoterrenum DSM 13490 TaxID=1120987 RepID=A0A1H3G1S3_9BACT|nr:oligopeptide/dipeptide ABC transporter ATP-binding protein [Acetomicrobium thermoterrenum]SDX97166.1 oligopeptide transport system ATP-binding protein [Acetomicrobium thermoterrenum DSM 13490]
MSEILLQLQDLRVYFSATSGTFGKKQYIRAVDGIDLEVKAGEVLGLVGESGCGKSTLGRAIVRLVEALGKSKVYYRGIDVLSFDKRQLKDFRKKAQMVFQDPFGSLNPRLTVGDTIEEVLIVHERSIKLERKHKVEKLMDAVGLAKHFRNRYPHELSGGQRQRVVIARALAIDPEFLICDEPVSALDVSIRAQIINLFEELQKRFNLTYLFISHDMSVVRHISTRVAVMYLGKIVEIAETDTLFDTPLHPYTQALLEAIPDVLEDRDVRRRILEGDVPSPLHPPEGCRFHPRCFMAKERCSIEEPPLIKKGIDHFVACHYA